MKKVIFILLLSPFIAFCQSVDGKGKAVKIGVTELGKSQMAKNLKITSYGGEEGKYKKGRLLESLQWFNFEDEEGNIHRVRREYIDGYFMYDEELTPIQQTAEEEIRPTIRHSGKTIAFETETDSDDNSYVYDGTAKVYERGILQATFFFEKGRPYKIYINHYFLNGQLQFVREIVSEGIGQPLKNVGALEAYYPNGSVFENPITEDGSAIIILNEAGKPEGQCVCMGQNIMEWGEAYLFAFIGKYYYLLEDIYRNEEMDCCWE